jgi:hypothetical protein
MRPRAVVPFLAIVLFAATGCDLVSDPEGPRPEDFLVQEDTSEVRSTEDDETANEVELRHDVAAPLSTARGGVTRGSSAPH